MQPDSPLASSFVAASHFGHVTRTKGDVRWIVIHTAECAVTDRSAEAVEGYFSMASTGVSAHYSADPDSIDQSVPESAIAWAAGHHGNLYGIHIELAGYARETAIDWGSAPNQATLALVANLVADIAARWDIPLAPLSAGALTQGASGVTTHAAISKCWRESGHTDPGVSFDLDAFIGLCVLARSQSPSTSPTT